MKDELTQHRFTPPADTGVTGPQLYPVVIAGAGSVGLTLALALARHGVRSVLLERSDTVGAGSRALGMSRRTMEIWEALGVAGPIMDIGLTWNSGRSFFRDAVVADFVMPGDPHVRHSPMLNIAQCQVDEILVKALEQTGMAELRWQTELVDIETHSGSDESSSGPARLTVQTPDGEYQLDASHVVACDGGRSTIRSRLGLRLEGTSFDSRYLIVDIWLETDHPAERRAWFDPPSNPGSTVLMHRQPGDIWRLDYQLRPDDDLEEALAPDNVEARVQDHLSMIGETGQWEIKWVSSYRANSAALSDFQHGPVIFAGDAAHLIPIFGIRGLNSGVEDAWTLAWKLANTQQGSAGSGLLRSYSSERVTAARENLAAANRSTRVMTPDTPGLQLMRDATLSLAIDRSDVREILNPRQGAPVAALGSPLNTLDDERHFSAGPAPGESLPDVAVTVHHIGQPATTHLLALLHPTGFSLVTFADSADQADNLRQGQPELAVVAVLDQPGDAGSESMVVDTNAQLATRLDASSGTTYLVRPDHLVCARWRCVDHAKIAAALTRAQGETGPQGPPAQAQGPELNSAERRYQALAAAVDKAGDVAAALLLAKFALLAAIERDDEEFQQLLDASSKHLQPHTNHEEP